MSPNATRAQRVADQMQRELAALVQREVNDPRVGMVSITGVELSPDLANARVYITVMDPSVGNPDPLRASAEAEQGRRGESLQALNGASAYLRTLLSRRLNLRKAPRLRFFYDHSAATGQRLSKLIDDALEADRQQHSG